MLEILNNWITEILGFLGLVSAILTKIVYTKSVIQKELTQVLHLSDTKNENLLKLAEKLDLKQAVKVVQKLIKG